MIYAEDIDGNSIHIDDAVKGNTYYFRYEDKEYEIIVAHGDKYRKHYKTKRGEDIDANIIFHKDCQKYIKENKIVEVYNLTIICDKVLLEAEAARYIKAKIPDYSMRPDCLFLDSDGEIMCIVEVNVTHAKSDQDIEKIEQYKIPTIELTYGKRKDNYKKPEGNEWLYLSEITTQIRDCHQRIKIGEVEIHNLKTEEDRRNKQLPNIEDPEIREFEREISELEREIREEEGLNTAFNKYIARLQSENYKKRLENEQTKQTKTT
jgi:hypothetical protein